MLNLLNSFVINVFVLMPICISSESLSENDINFNVNDLFKVGVSTIGCQFDASVCGNGDMCFDDGLFGTCKNPIDFQQKSSTFSLDQINSRVLSHEMAKLVVAGYTWDDDYTQCVIKNVLLSHRYKLPYHSSFCIRTLVNRDRFENGDETVKEMEQVKKNKHPLRKLHRDSDGENKSAIENDDYHFIDPYSQSVFRAIKDDLLGSESNSRLEEENPIVAKQNVPENVDDIQHRKREDNQQVIRHKYQLERPIVYENSNGLPATQTKQYLKEKILNSIERKENFKGTAKINSGENVEELLSDITRDEFQLISDLLNEKVDVNQFSNDVLIRISQILQQLVKSLNLQEVKSDSGSKNDDNSEIKKTDGVDLEKNKKRTPQQFNTKSSAEKPVAEEMSGFFNAGTAKQRIVVQQPKTNDLHMRPAHKRKLSKRAEKLIRKNNQLALVDKDWIWVEFKSSQGTRNRDQIKLFLNWLAKLLQLPQNSDAKWKDDTLYVSLPPMNLVNGTFLTPKDVAKKLKSKEWQPPGLEIINTGLGKPGFGETAIPITYHLNNKWTMTLIICSVILGIICVVICLFMVQKYRKSREKIEKLSQDESDVNNCSTGQVQDYQDLCRQRMQLNNSDKMDLLSDAAARLSGSGSNKLMSVGSPPSLDSSTALLSTTSWNEEPVQTKMDISTGHLILSYMENHLHDKDKLALEWKTLCSYEPDAKIVTIAINEENKIKNRYVDILPYDHSRVKLNKEFNATNSDYINANFIYDNDPKHPNYILTQGPLGGTVADFWQMIWEQNVLIIVNLTRAKENGLALCHRYWPDEGAELYHFFEVHLVSEHVWCEDYLVRSFYLKNVRNGETRTVTQFHFLSWLDLSVPKVKAALDFRRKVNKSFRDKTNPIVIHCSDGCGRSGTYAIFDLVLNRVAKGVKEFDIAATLEHMRDQRCDLVKTKDQFEFVLTAVAEEVHSALKSMTQQ